MADIRIPNGLPTSPPEKPAVPDTSAGVNKSDAVERGGNGGNGNGDSFVQGEIPPVWMRAGAEPPSRIVARVFAGLPAPETPPETVTRPVAPVVSPLVQEMADRWGTDTTVVHQALERFSRLVGNGPEDLPSHSRLTSVQMGFWFAFAIADLLVQIVKGKVKGDIRLEDFNRLLPVVSSYIMRASGWSPNIDPTSLSAITRAILRSRLENRPLLITNTHESWTDITAIASLFRGLPNRFVYKKELELVPGLGFVLIFADMTPVARPPKKPEEADFVNKKGFMNWNKYENALAKYERALAGAIAEMEATAEKITRLGTISIDFTPGTRSRAGAGVGVAKKGFANLLIDLDAVGLVLNVEGTSQIMPVSWGKFLATEGAGTNRRVDVRAVDIYHEDYKPAEGLSEGDQRKAHVQAIRDAAEAIQVRNGIAIIDDWRRSASSLGEVAEPAQPVEPVQPANRERVQLDELLDHFVDAFRLIDTHDEKGLRTWCEKGRVAVDYVRALREWIPTAELKALYMRYPDETDLPWLLEIATPLSDPFGKNKEAPVEARRARDLVNQYLDASREAFLQLRLEPENFNSWAEDHGIDAASVRLLAESLPPEEIDGVFARAGHVLYRPLKGGQRYEDADRTWQTMRTQRFGKWLVGNLLSRSGRKLLTPWKSPVPGRPQIGQREAPGEPPGFERLAHAYDSVYAPEYERTRALIEDQLQLQSDDFKRKWDRFFKEARSLQSGYREHFRAFVDNFFGRELPSAEPVSQASDRLHRAIVASPLLDFLPATQRIETFYLMQAQSDYDALHVPGERGEAYLRARAHFYGLLGKIASLRIKDKIADNLKTDPRRAGFKSLPRYLFYAPWNIALRNRAERVVLVCEALARGVALDRLLEEIQGQIKAHQETNKWLKRHMPVQYAKEKQRQLQARRHHLGYLVKKYGADSDLNEVLNELIGDEFQPLPEQENLTFEKLLKGDSNLRGARDGYEEAYDQWVAASRVDFDRFAPQVFETEKVLFRFTLELHRLDAVLQTARYADLMQQAREYGGVSREHEKRFAQAMGAYRLAMDEYFANAEAIANLAPEGKEPQRKTKETKVLREAWLALQWVVADIYKEIEHPHAGRLEPFSAMFVNQAPYLNNVASGEQEGIKPFFEAITFDKSLQAWMETVLGGRDPRRVAQVIGEFGLDALARSQDDVVIMGGAVLAGLVGQSSGAALAEGGFHLLTEAQARDYGFVPRTVVYDANHVGYNDLQLVALKYGVGLGQSAQAYEKKNFEQFPTLGTAFVYGDGVGFERDRDGSEGLQRALANAHDRGVSPFVFGSGTMRVLAEMLPLSDEPIALFAPRPSIVGGNRAEAALMARRVGTVLVHVWQAHPQSVHPDIGLSGGLWAKNVIEPYGLLPGVPLGGTAVLSYGSPFPGEAFPGTADELHARLGVEGARPKQEGNGEVRRYMAAWTEMGKVGAYFNWLASEAAPLNTVAGLGVSAPALSPVSPGIAGVAGVAGAAATVASVAVPLAPAVPLVAMPPVAVPAV
ncbi:MAG: 1-acyl-sn-glycerol-3-phosphate acyltransferase [Deltaproteobacteria bacterium]|nr:1-acyl-sn-glycerol-3-phosphate acyltransferase [Deltaproteobacteria bacterium]